MIALVASLALQVAFEDEAARAYAVKAQESLASNVLITPPSLVHGVGWLQLGKVHAPISLSPRCKALVNRMGVGKVTEELWQAALGDRLSTASLRDLVILEREQNVANFWAVSKTTLKERYRRVALAWLLHNNREKLKSFQRYAVLARFEAEARGLRVPMGLIRAAKTLRLDPSDGSTTIQVVASALAKPLATAEELRWAEEVTTQALKVPLRRLRAQLTLVKIADAEFTARPSARSQQRLLQAIRTWLQGKEAAVEESRDLWELREKEVSQWAPKR